MHKTFDEKTKDFFITMGKKHRLLLPLAIVGLAVTMLISHFIGYCKAGSKRFLSVAFVALFFLFGNSFAFPIFNLNNGFISDKPSEKTIAAEDSMIALDSVYDEENDIEAVAESVENLSTEYGAVDEEETVSLEEILNDRDFSKNESSEPENEEEDIKVFDPKDWKITLINKQHPIPEDYSFTLGTLKGSMQCDERILDDLLSMMKAASDDDISLMVCSPYRNLDLQEDLFERKLNYYTDKGYSYIDSYKLSSQAVTIPGSSEHQVGLAIDFITENYRVLEEGFEDTDAGIWLKNNCADYGFILRYPKDKEYITSIEYEPWHFRYVGKDAAKIIMSEGICLEEFWDKYL